MVTNCGYRVRNNLYCPSVEKIIANKRAKLSFLYLHLYSMERKLAKYFAEIYCQCGLCYKVHFKDNMLFMNEWNDYTS